MFAVIKTGGKQYRTRQGDVLEIEKLDAEKGAQVTFEEVLLVEDGGNVLIGTPFVENAAVQAVVLDKYKNDKIIVFKKKRRKQYKKTRGHRQELTRVKIEQILTKKPLAAAKLKAKEEPKEDAKVEAEPKAEPKAQEKAAAVKTEAAAKTKPKEKQAPAKASESKPKAAPPKKKAPAKKAATAKKAAPAKPKSGSKPAAAPKKTAALKTAKAAKPAGKAASKAKASTKGKKTGEVKE